MTLRSPSLLLALFQVLLLLTTLTHAVAQPPRPVSVHASIASQRIYVGEPVMLVVDVSNADHAQALTPPSSSDYTIALIGEGNTSQTSIVIINGVQQDRSTRSYRFQYSITFNRTGRVTVPPLSVTVDADTFATQPLEVAVIEPAIATGSTLTLTPTKNALYVGEPILLTLVWTLDTSANAPAVTIPVPDSFDLLVPSAWQPSTARPNPGEKLVEVIVNSERAVGIVGSVQVGGETRTTLTIRRILVPTAPGEFKLPPAKLLFQVPSPRRRNSIFDSPFVDTSDDERRIVIAQPLHLTVAPLPLPAPPNFTGLVGEFSLDAAATPTILSVGDPFTLSVRVGGPEPLDRVPPLDLASLPGFSSSFKLQSEPALPSVLPTAAIYTLELRALHERVKELPPIEMSYFDVKQGRYSVARSKPIPLMVSATNEVTLDDHPADTTPGSATAATPDPARDALRLPAISPALDSSLLDRLTLAHSIASPAGALMMSAPVGLYAASLLAGVLRRRREHNAPAIRRHRAARRARKRLRRAAPTDAAPREISAALRGYVADCLNLPEPGVTSADALRFFAAHAATCANAAAALLADCDRAMFAPAPQAPHASATALDHPALLQRARRLLEQTSQQTPDSVPSAGGPA